MNENKILREIMLANGISFPGKSKSPSMKSISPTSSIRVIGNPGSEQRLQVSVAGGYDAPHIFPPNSFVDPQNAASPWHSPGSVASVNDYRATNGVPLNSQTRGFANNPCYHSGSTRSLIRHPFGLDATQVGVDFVLLYASPFTLPHGVFSYLLMEWIRSLEHHCLQHARTSCANTPFSGHVLTFQTPLLSGGPDVLHDNDSWEIPACYLDRLFDLAGALNLEGDITPVQAWNRIKDHPSFYKLTPEGLRNLAVSLRKEVQCFG